MPVVSEIFKTSFIISLYEGYFPDKICSWRAAGTDFDSSGDSEKAVHPLRWEETS